MKQDKTVGSDTGITHSQSGHYTYEGIDKITIKCPNISDQQKLTEALDKVFKRVSP
jgi:hypothetical protein